MKMNNILITQYSHKIITLLADIEKLVSNQVKEMNDQEMQLNTARRHIAKLLSVIEIEELDKKWVDIYQEVKHNDC